jgi:hypothetical protein
MDVQMHKLPAGCVFNFIHSNASLFFPAAFFQQQYRFYYTEGIALRQAD